MQTVLVVGAGQMGSGIAQVMVQAGLDTYLHDVSAAGLEVGRARIADLLRKGSERGKWTAEAVNAALARLHIAHDLEAAKHVDLVIEAVIEDAAVKTALLVRLDTLCKETAILASNTSSLPITTLAAATGRPPQVIGMHFMNPVPVMALVELIRGLQTSDVTYQAIYDLTVRIGKTPVTVQDAPGFIANRILMPMINEAICAFQEGIATATDIDTVMKLGMRHPMGPLELADFIGLDTCLAIMNVLHDGFGDPKYRPALKLKQMVSAGMLGRKVNQGFYSYREGQRVP
ncbi:MAG: 3-hydroxybutyryl-CoA dehydrogenase [Candidatus Sericytochromatia bacterium]|nr:3-hydroxybutyryl-CoA dehydrogenase [Candidatus Sericytochromatia bacterium]